jgi:SAM-dependent methyltransferase
MSGGAGAAAPETPRCGAVRVERRTSARRRRTMKQHAPATLRNRSFILDVLKAVLPPRGLVLEIAAGTGEHAAFLAEHLPGLLWQPSDVEPGARASIDGHRLEAGLHNLLPPIALDASSDTWPLAQPVDAIVCINMIHIAPWRACEGLMRGAGRALRPGGALYLYGPYRIDGGFTAESNAVFDASLRAREPAWGVRDLEAVTALAAASGLEREAVIPMPANNHSVVFRRAGGERPPGST